MAGAIIKTRLVLTVVNVGFTLFTSKTRLAGAQKVGNEVCTVRVAVTGIGIAFVNFWRLKRRDKISIFAHANFAPCKRIQDSRRFWTPHHGFQIPGIEFRILCQWSLNSGFQSLVGFQIPWAVFWIPKPKILDFTSKTLPDERIRISLHGATNYPSFITFSADGLLQKLYLIQHSTWPFSGRAAELVPKGVSCHLPMQSCGLFDPGRTVAVVPGHGTQIRLSLWGWKERRLHKVHGARPVGEKEPDGQETGGNNKKNIQVRQTFM